MLRVAKAKLSIRQLGLFMPNPQADRETNMVKAFMIFALISTISILGCATAAQNQAASISQNQQLVIERSAACFGSARNNPNYLEVISKKI